MQLKCITTLITQNLKGDPMNQKQKKELADTRLKWRDFLKTENPAWWKAIQDESWKATTIEKIMKEFKLQFEEVMKILRDGKSKKLVIKKKGIKKGCK